MKQIEDIVQMSSEELEAKALEAGGEAPSGLGKTIEDAILASEVLHGQKPARAARYGFWAAAAVAAACLAVILAPPRAPQDSFDDPLMAYAELEKTFEYISSKMDRGLEIAAKADPAINTTTQAITKLK